jgi:hypothetical protein
MELHIKDDFPLSQTLWHKGAHEQSGLMMRGSIITLAENLFWEFACRERRLFIAF